MNCVQGERKFYKTKREFMCVCVLHTKSAEVVLGHTLHTFSHTHLTCLSDQHLSLKRGSDGMKVEVCVRADSDGWS